MPAAADRDGRAAQPDRAPDQDLVPEPPHEVQEGAETEDGREEHVRGLSVRRRGQRPERHGRPAAAAPDADAGRGHGGAGAGEQPHAARAGAPAVQPAGHAASAAATVRTLHCAGHVQRPYAAAATAAGSRVKHEWSVLRTERTELSAYARRGSAPGFDGGLFHGSAAVAHDRPPCVRWWVGRGRRGGTPTQSPSRYQQFTRNLLSGNLQQRAKTDPSLMPTRQDSPKAHMPT